MNRRVFLLFYALIVSVSSQLVFGVAPLIMSEVMTANKATLADEEGDFPDWVEIHNASALPVQLGGWALSDDPLRLQKWVFPEVELAPGGYLVVFASGKNRASGAGPLHTNFKLSNEGEYLALVDETGAVIHEFAPVIPELKRDMAYGIELGGIDGTAGVFELPTPGGPNRAVRPYGLAKVQFSQRGGLFAEPFQLTLSTDIPGAIIRYTTGGVPTLRVPPYSGPVSIFQTTEIRAQLYLNGLPIGQLASETYIRLAPNLQDFTSNLPIVILDNFGSGEFPSTGYRSSHLVIFERAGERSRLSGQPVISTRAGARIRGSSSLNRPKKAYAVEARDEEDLDRDIAPLGMPAESDWILYAPYNFDRALIRNAFVYEVSNQLGRYAVRTRFVEVFANTNDRQLSYSDYVGVYVLMEKIKRREERVDVESLPASADAEPLISGGYMLKIDRLDPGDLGLSVGGQAFGYVYPKEQEITLVQKNWIRNYLAAFYQTLQSASFADPVDGYAQYMDVDSWIDHHLINEFTKNPDGLRLSTYLFKRRGGKLEMGPVWDFDRTLGPDDDARAADPTGWSSVFYYNWWNRLFQDPHFWLRYMERWGEFRADVFRVENLHRIIDHMAEELREAQARNYQRWPQSRGSLGWENEILELKTWVARRVEWLDGTLLKKPQFFDSQRVINPGYRLRFLGPGRGATIVYTVDGTDPRLPDGSLSPRARTDTVGAEAVLFKPTKVIARYHYPVGLRRWSVVNEATFVLEELPTIKVTEVMYHPPSVPGGAWEDEDFEFIELVNAGHAPWSLLGYKLEEGIDFTFPDLELQPGKAVVVVQNQAAFAERYPESGPIILGEFDRNLGNSGDTIRAVDVTGRVLFELSYSDSSPWPAAADGQGSSLELKNWGGSFALPEQWVASGWGGSPGELPPPFVELSLSQTAEGALRIVFIAPDGQPFVLEGADDLDGNWRTVTPDNLVRQNGRVEIFQPMNEGNRFYRIRIP